MEAEERAQIVVDWLLSQECGSAVLTAAEITKQIRAAETEAHNKAVEACAEWLRTKRRVKHGGFDFPALGISMMCEVLKREQ